MDTLFSRELKFSNDASVSGYGSVFNNTDLGNDIVAPGAFTKSLAGKKTLPMLFQHEPSQAVGVWDALAEDQHGLKVSGRISDTALGRDVRTLAKDGAVTGLSIGFRPVDTDWTDDGVRLIKQAELWEVSLVTFPMNDLARVESVKSQLRKGETPTSTDMEFFLKRAGLSRRATKRLMEGGYAAFAKSEPELSEVAKQIADLRASLMR